MMTIASAIQDCASGAYNQEISGAYEQCSEEVLKLIKGNCQTKYSNAVPIL
jgi:hypothetical protein